MTLAPSGVFVNMVLQKERLREPKLPQRHLTVGGFQAK